MATSWDALVGVRFPNEWHWCSRSSTVCRVTFHGCCAPSGCCGGPSSSYKSSWRTDANDFLYTLASWNEYLNGMKNKFSFRIFFRHHHHKVNDVEKIDYDSMTGCCLANVTTVARLLQTNCPAADDTQTQTYLPAVIVQYSVVVPSMKPSKTNKSWNSVDSAMKIFSERARGKEKKVILWRREKKTQIETTTTTWILKSVKMSDAFDATATKTTFVRQVALIWFLNTIINLLYCQTFEIM